MARARVPLTRSTLLETQRSLAFAREGYGLLDRKREILLAALTAATPEAEEAMDALARSLVGAHAALARARMAVGADSVRRAALAALDGLRIEVTERSVVGAVVPEIACAPPEERPHYSLAGSAAELDGAAAAFGRLVETLCRAAQTETAVLRLALEMRKTQRRVNALRNLVIPRQEAIIKEVREALEDAEREAFFQTKRLTLHRSGRHCALRRDEPGNRGTRI